MNAVPKIDKREPGISESWAGSLTDDLERSRRLAWIVAAVAGTVALLLAIAIVIMLPLKTVEPYTILVDRQTGNVEALDPLADNTVLADNALTRSFLMQYVTARESFVPDSFDQDYAKVTLMSGPEERQKYITRMSANNPLSPLSYMSPGGTIRVEMRSVIACSPRWVSRSVPIAAMRKRCPKRSRPLSQLTVANSVTSRDAPVRNSMPAGIDTADGADPAAARFGEFPPADGYGVGGAGDHARGVTTDRPDAGLPPL